MNGIMKNELDEKTESFDSLLWNVAKGNEKGAVSSLR